MSEEREIWLEKYRPQSLDNIKGQEDVIDSLRRYIEDNHIPNLLFSGPPGVGKTATAVSVAKEIYGSDWEDNFLELNASDDRGIDVVRENIKDFARTSTGSAEFRLIFLDEADSLTSDAQGALRRTMEKFSNNVRFILSCNYSSQIIEPIQSRCAVYRFTDLSDDAIEEQVKEIIECESINMTDAAISALVYTSNGDMRRAINGLQSLSVYDREITEELVYTLTNNVRPSEIAQILELSLDGEFTRARSQTRDIIIERGVSPVELLDQIYSYIWDEKSDIEKDKSQKITEYLSKADYRISQGANSDLQVDSLLSEISDI